MRIKNKYTIGKSALVLLMLSSSLFALGQADNSLERIDSLTKELYGFEEAECISSITLLETTSVNAHDYEEIMNKMGSSIDYRYNSYVQSQINHMSYSNCKMLKEITKKGNTYFKLFEPIIDQYGIPNELKYLPVIESGLKPEAVSRAGASGLWQFMPGTGKFLNMKIGSEVDERYNVKIATHKACEYLQRMYNDFGNWSLALAAYNAGPGNVRKAITKSGGSRDFWKIQRFLPGETKNYVPRFMATVYLMEHVVPEMVDDCSIDSKMIVSINIKSKLHLKHIATYLGVTVDEIIKYNPMYRKYIVDNTIATREIYLPYDLAMRFSEMEDHIYSLAMSSITNNIETKWITRTLYHKVQEGEKMASIADLYGVSSYQIKRWNRMKNYKLYTGRNLKIRQRQLVCTNPTLEEGVYSYVIEKGETVRSICGKIPNLDKKFILTQNYIDTDIEVLNEGRIIEVHYGKVYTPN